jgi:hypothetical protein
MSKKGVKGAKPKRKAVRHKRAAPRIKLDAEPWYANAARSIGISARDPRRAATGANALPP